MNKKLLITTGLFTLLNYFGIANAGLPRPTYSIELAPGFSPTIQIASNATTTVNYKITNLESVPRFLTAFLKPLAPAVHQIVTTPGSCAAPFFMLARGQSCTLELQINGALVVPNHIISSLPTVCKTKVPGSAEPDPNRCARSSFPLNISSINPPNNVAQQTVAFFTSYTNSMTFPIQPTLPPGAIAWKVQPTVAFIWKLFAKVLNAGTGIPASASLLSESCGSAFNGAAYCAIVGQNNSAPFIMQSYNGGTTWTNVSVPSLPAQGQITSVSCGTDPNGINTCVAIGADSATNPFAIQTIDNGQSWSLVTAVSFAGSTLNGVNCTVNGLNNLCQIAAYNPGLQGPTLFTFVGTSSWTLVPLFTSGVDPNSGASEVSCASLPSSAISCLVELNNSGSSISLFKTQLSGGSTYTATPVLNSVTQGSLNSVSCTLNAGTAFCIAAGSQSGTPFLLANSDISIDANWNAIATTPSAGVFTTASCAAAGGKINCVAAGYNGSTGSPTPLLVATTNGSTWSLQNAPGVPSVGYYNSSSASVSSGIPFSFANGVNPSVNQPFSIGTNPDGSWQVANTLTSVFTLH